MDEEKNGDITSFIEYLIYNNSKIYLEILDKDDDNYTMGPNDVFNFLVDVFLGIMEKRYGVGSTDELNEFEFNERIIEFITTKYLQIGVKLTFCNCVNKCVMKPIIMKQVSKKPLIYCEFENKLIECKYCDTICDASKSELMFLFPSQIA